MTCEGVVDAKLAVNDMAACTEDVIEHQAGGILPMLDLPQPSLQS